MSTQQLEETAAASEASAPSIDDVMEKYEQRKVRRREDGGASGPDAQVDVDERQKANCTKCGEPFTFIPVKVQGVTVTPDRCRDCVHRERLAIESDAAADDVSRLAAAREEREARRLELLHAITGNAAEHRDMLFTNFDDSECGSDACDIALNFLLDVRSAGPYDATRGVLFHGDTGTGKTHLIVAVVNSLLLDPSIRPEDIVFDRADELIMRIQDTYGSGRSTFDEILDRRFNARLWILDDFGTEKTSEDAARLLTLIFSRRAMRPTAVTMNGQLEELVRTRPDLARVLSRFGPRYFRVVPVNGRDRRFD